MGSGAASHCLKVLPVVAGVAAGFLSSQHILMAGFDNRGLVVPVVVA
jgi:hypothetical protein